MADQRLKDRNARIVESVGIGIWEVDLATGQAEWSAEMAASMGMTLAEFDGRVETFFVRVHPDDRDKVQRASESALNDGAPFGVEFRVVWPDGTVRWLENKGRVTYGPDGKATHIGGIGLDITNRKMLEHQLYEAQKLDALGRLAGGVAHDFNNLLTAILGFSELLASDLDGEDRRLSDVGEITHAATSASALTQQLLAFSRKQAIEPGKLNINHGINRAERTLRRLLGDKIDLRMQLDPGVHDIWADATQIEQVLVNLAVNARDAMPNGGRLTIATSNVELSREHVSFQATVTPGPYVRLTVSDTGQGMSPEVQSRMFEPFFTTKAAGHGTGLGLSTVYGITRQSGGSVWVYSEQGQGTTVTLHFPRLDDPHAAVVEPVETPTEDLFGHARVLLVEDNAQVRRLAARGLTNYGYAVIEAGNPTEAIALATAATPPIELLITDVVLPGMNGGELASQLRRTQPTLKLLFMSGYTGDAVAHHLTDAGDAAFLQKPFTAVSLARHVRLALKTVARPAV